MDNTIRKPKYCRINKYTVVYLIERNLLSTDAQIMGKDVISVAIWTEINSNNVNSIKDDLLVTEFVIRKRFMGPINKDPLNIL